MSIETTTIKAPSHWASYFINGDASGLTDKEQAQADAWLAREQVEIIDVADDENGEPQEPHFSWNVQLYAPEVDYRGGDLLEYVAINQPGLVS